jgi:hypothetical protein
MSTKEERAVPTTCPACLSGAHEDPVYSAERCGCCCHGKPVAGAIPTELAEAQREWRDFHKAIEGPRPRPTRSFRGPRRPRRLSASCKKPGLPLKMRAPKPGTHSWSLI